VGSDHIRIYESYQPYVDPRPIIDANIRVLLIDHQVDVIETSTHPLAPSAIFIVHSWNIRRKDERCTRNWSAKDMLHTGEAVRGPIAEASFGTVQGGRELRPDNTRRMEDDVLLNLSQSPNWHSPSSPGSSRKSSNTNIIHGAPARLYKHSDLSSAELKGCPVVYSRPSRLICSSCDGTSFCAGLASRFSTTGSSVGTGENAS